MEVPFPYLSSATYLFQRGQNRQRLSVLHVSHLPHFPLNPDQFHLQGEVKSTKRTVDIFDTVLSF